MQYIDKDSFLNICQYLDPQDLLNLVCVCNNYNKHLSDDDFWYQIYLKSL